MTTKLTSLFITLSCLPIFSQVNVGTSHLIESTLPTESFDVFELQENFESTDLTGFSFQALGSNMFFYQGSSLDDGVAVFLVDSNDVFSEANISANNFTELTFGTTYTFTSNFYLGLRTPAFDTPQLPPRDFGWAEFQNTGDDLILIDHAVAYNAQGIIVDTTTAIVPEPSQVSLLSLGILGMMMRRSRR